ncbi:MAG TPA: large-conductance mechanosensitive channel protein MscL [Sedimentibacter sp.]|jgi:large conductance mechanosensitive channel|nr:large-conductance mechanosensitive channel protein MscL [Sedimentibacter sp.]HOA19445.1 large-conductance mechanosensitive channel protein MscL [Sedimentibacter sp.]HOG62585.1 large-conductance mechanosensitive channel protein MscL [Sedimentibacter sp.]HPY55578.1 large-conductance mechanosensitive channel protein MscL [Sedimentibacter sp.]HQC69610.1 large-conductance mechanosensitive channel protein MscL [Sedimentibacter sp.]
MWDDFKKFAFQGNVLDLAIGVIMGGAFGKIVTSVVNDLIMPVLGYLMAGIDFKDMKYVMSEAIMEGDTVIKPEAAIMYGNFIQNVVDFLIVALSIFLFIKLINKSKEKLKKQEEAAPEPEAPPAPTQEELLTEIRDLLKEK